MSVSTENSLFVRNPSSTPASAEQVEAILANPGFGEYFTDHTSIIEFTENEGAAGQWGRARVEAYGPISLDPAAAVLHYGQEIFEGLKAYKHSDGGIYTFRPQKNAERLRRSAYRLALPELPEDLFLASLEELVQIDQRWVPTKEGESLYLRPFMIGTEAFLGIRPARHVRYQVIASPAGNYFGGELEPVDIWVSRTYARAGKGTTGAAKCGGNYAASLLPQMEAAAKGCKQVLFLDESRGNAIEELGGMNAFVIYKDGTLVTPALSGSILEGVTRDSLMQLGIDRGLNVQERTLTLDEWRDGVNSGDITEAFACGTAAVVTPIGALVDGETRIGAPDAKAGEITMSLREELVGIQTGAVEDRHNWLYRLA